MPGQYDIPVGFQVDLSGLQSGFRRAQAQVTSFGQQAKKSLTNAGSSISSLGDRITTMSAKFNVVTAAAQSALQVITQVATAVVDLSLAYDQAEKSARYFQDVMGPLADKGSEWAQSLSDQYGLYTTDVESYLGSLMEAFQRAGNSLSDSYNMAQDFTQLSYDLSAYFPNYDLSEIQDMLLDLARGGGEEALEKLASGFDEDELKARAVAMGIAEVGEELTVLQKQKAAYDIIMGEHGSIQGLYGETDNATKSMNSLDSATKNLKETLGSIFSPVVEAVGNALAVVVNTLDKLIKKVQEAFRTVRDLFKSGINRLTNFIGFGDVFDMTLAVDTDDVERAETDTSALEDALASLSQQAQETRAAMEGLAGFDRLYTVKDTGTVESNPIADWESAFDQWLALFLTMPDEAIDKLDPLWDTILDGSDKTVDSIKESYGQYFDWIMDSELANTELTQEEKQAIMDEFYQDLADANSAYNEAIAAEDEEYAQLRADVEAGISDKTLEEIEAEHNATTANITDAYQTQMSAAFATVLAAFGITSKEEADAMKDAFEQKVAEIEAAYGTVFDGLHQQLDELNAAIATVRSDISSASSSLTQSSGLGDFFQKVTDIGGDIWDVATGDKSWDEARADDADRQNIKFFAEGGLFQPNSPQLVVMGDNPTEPEVAAPRSMIEDAMQNVISRNGGLSSGGQDINLTCTIELDGKVLARQLYKYNQQLGIQKGARTTL